MPQQYPRLLSHTPGFFNIPRWRPSSLGDLSLTSLLIRSGISSALATSWSITSNVCIAWESLGVGILLSKNRSKEFIYTLFYLFLSPSTSLVWWKTSSSIILISQYLRDFHYCFGNPLQGFFFLTNSLLVTPFLVCLGSVALHKVNLINWPFEFSFFIICIQVSFLFLFFTFPACFPYVFSVLQSLGTRLVFLTTFGFL